jgi:hypothetical protein
MGAVVGGMKIRRGISKVLAKKKEVLKHRLTNNFEVGNPIR